MADDDRLLELLAQALQPGDAEPPADRIAALRIQAAARQARDAAAAPATAQDGAAESAPSSPPPPAEPVPLHRSRPSATALRSRKAGWLAAGAAVAAAAVVIALIAVPALDRDRGRETSVASGSVSTTRDAVTRLRAALVSRDPLVVARADAELVRLARQLPPAERALLEAEVVQAHVEAVQFLREYATPEVLAAVPPAPPPGQLPPEPPPGGAVTAVPTTAPGDVPPAPTTVAPPVPSTAAPRPSVRITAVTATVDGSFAVEFTVSGFTPDNSHRPDSYAVRFSFDDGQEPQVWAGPSPWTFPTDNAIRFEQVCAVVVDARRVEQPGSGNCVPIL